MTIATQIWIEFAVCVAFIGVAGFQLARCGDAIASLSGVSQSWVGMILVATVTSLPELVTGLSAVTIASTPDIAVGDALGSCVFNLLILAIVDLVHRKGSIYTLASRVHVISAGFGVMLLIVAGLGLVLRGHGTLPSFGHVSVISVALIVIYIVAIRVAFRAEPGPGSDNEPDQTQMTLRQALVGYAIAAAVIVAAGIWLPFVGVQLAHVMGWSDTFVGTLFIAFATSVPELATTLGAVKIGAINLAIGNVMGSNLFDLLIIALDDLAYLKAPIFTQVTTAHLASVVFACLMNGAVILALIYRPAGRVARTMSWAGITLVVLFLMSAIVQFLHSR